MRVRILTAMIFLFLFGMAQTSHAYGCPWKCTVTYTETQSTAICQAGGRMATCELFYACAGTACDVWCDGNYCYWA